MSETRATRGSTPLWAVLVVCLLVTGAVVWYMTRGGDTPADSGNAKPSPTVAVDTPSASVSESTDAEPSEPAADPLSEEVSKQAAEEGLTAYLTISYTDPSPNSWIDRVGELSTEGFRNSLAEVFPLDAETQAYWDSEIVAHQISRKPVQIFVDPYPFGDQTDDARVYDVKYAVSTRHGDGEWGYPQHSTSQLVYVVRDGDRWLVDNISLD